jgi:molybdopterin converting factor small subunit
MSSVRIPTPLRPYAGGQREIEVQAGTVGAALDQLAADYPALRPHLFDDGGALRQYVNLFLNDEDVRGLEGRDTPLRESDRLTIVPSIAGGAPAGSPVPEVVDHSALRTNQAIIIGGLLAAFILDSVVLAGLVGAVMLIGSAIGRPGFLPVYRLLRRMGLVRPDRLPDHGAPHRFAQTVGGVFLAAASFSLLAGAPLLGWALAWVVIGLAALNLFGGFCVGCAMYYWLNRLGAPGFVQEPPPGVRPGRAPHHGGSRA